MSVRITGLKPLAHLQDIGWEFLKNADRVHKDMSVTADSIFAKNTPVKTGATLASEGVEVMPDGFQVFADIEYSPYNDQGFNHWRNGYIQGYHYSDKVVDQLNLVYANKMGEALMKAIQTVLSRTI